MKKFWKKTEKYNNFQIISKITCTDHESLLRITFTNYFYGLLFYGYFSTVSFPRFLFLRLLFYGSSPRLLFHGSFSTDHFHGSLLRITFTDYFYGLLLQITFTDHLKNLRKTSRKIISPEKWFKDTTNRAGYIYGLLLRITFTDYFYGSFYVIQLRITFVRVTFSILGFFVYYTRLYEIIRNYTKSKVRWWKKNKKRGK